MNIECLFGHGDIQEIGAYTLEGTTSLWEGGHTTLYGTLGGGGGGGELTTRKCS